MYRREGCCSKIWTGTLYGKMRLPGLGYSVERGEFIARENRYCLLDLFTFSISPFVLSLHSDALDLAIELFLQFVNDLWFRKPFGIVCLYGHIVMKE